MMAPLMAADLADSTLKAQRSQIERILKEKVAEQAAIGGEIKGLRAKIGSIDTTLVLRTRLSPTAPTDAPAAAATSTAAESDGGFFGKLKRLFGK